MRLSSAQPENSPSKKCFACWAGSVRVSVRVPHAALPCSAVRCDMALAHPRRACGSQVRSPKTPSQKNVLLVGQEARQSECPCAACGATAQRMRHCAVTWRWRIHGVHAALKCAARKLPLKKMFCLLGRKRQSECPCAACGATAQRTAL
jgi:hypothetical protein